MNILYNKGKLFRKRKMKKYVKIMKFFTFLLFLGKKHPMDKFSIGCFPQNMFSFLSVLLFLGRLQR